MSFQEYVTQQRIQRAKRLLLSTDMKIYEVALAVGIEDMNYFSYRFKSIVGVSLKVLEVGQNMKTVPCNKIICLFSHAFAMVVLIGSFYL